MLNASDRRQAVEPLKEAVDSGALYKACAELGISKRTYNRWKNTDSDYIDKRTICVRPELANKLTSEEKQEILDICNSEEFASKTPREIIPMLADRGNYIARKRSKKRGECFIKLKEREIGWGDNHPKKFHLLDAVVENLTIGNEQQEEKMIDYLLDEGAQIDKTTLKFLMEGDGGQSAFHEAAGNLSFDIFEYLK